MVKKRRRNKQAEHSQVDMCDQWWCSWLCTSVAGIELWQPTHASIHILWTSLVYLRSDRHLTATLPPVAVSRQRYVTPLPPRPNSSTTSYFPPSNVPRSKSAWWAEQPMQQRSSQIRRKIQQAASSLIQVMTPAESCRICTCLTQPASTPLLTHLPRQSAPRSGLAILTAGTGGRHRAPERRRARRCGLPGTAVCVPACCSLCS